MSTLQAQVVREAPPAGVLKHTVVLSGAAAINLPVPNMFLVRVRATASTTPGTFGMLYDGQAVAHFPAGIANVPTGTAQATFDHLVNFQVRGTVFPAASVQFNGGMTTVELTFSTQPPQGHPSITEYRAIRFARTDGGAVTGTVTVSYDQGPNKPRSITGNTSSNASNAAATLPSLGPFTQVYGCPAPVGQQGTPIEVSDLPAANSLTLTLSSTAATTHQYIVYY